MNVALLTLLLALAPHPGAGATVAPPHDLHISYGAAAVEGDALVVRIRFFKDDLEAALARHVRQGGYSLAPGPEAEQDFLAYLKTHVTVDVGGVSLEPSIVSSGEDELDREPVWWYVVHFQAPGPLTVFHMRNTLLTELFDDQTNIVKFVHFPDQKQKTFAFGRGEERFEVRF